MRLKLKCEATHTAVSPVDVQEGECQQSLVAFLWEELLFKLDKICFKVNHFWCTAIHPTQEGEQNVQVFSEFDALFEKGLKICHIQCGLLLWNILFVKLKLILTMLNTFLISFV